MADEFSATPTVQVASIDSWNVSGITTAAAGNGKMTVKWTDPSATITSDGVTLEGQLTDTQMALCDVYELLVGGEE